MTRQERVKYCAVCRNRELDLKQGVVCRQTREKADFEGTCADYIPDEDAVLQQQKRQQNLTGNSLITGWLAFFLWVGLGGGATVSLIRTIVDIQANPYSFFYILLLILFAAILAAVACYAIWAFYARRSNAVAIAKTYIALILIDGAFGLLFCVIGEDYEAAALISRQFIWGIVWYAYLKFSAQIEELFPSDKRSWGKIEKSALVVFILGYITVLAMVSVQASSNVMFTEEAYFQQVLEASKEELPIDLGDGVEMSDIEYADNTITFYYRNNGVFKNELDGDYLAEYAVDFKQDVLSDWQNSLLEDDFLARCCKARMTIVYTYLDEQGASLFRVSILPEEYADLQTGTRSLEGLSRRGE